MRACSIGTTLALVASVVTLALNIEAVERKAPNCPNTLGPISFDTFQHSCAVIHKKETYESQANKLSLENRLDIIESCSCALVSHEIAWASMVTHEAEALYLAIKKFIDETDQYLADIDSSPEDKAEQDRIASLKDQYDNQIQIKSEVKKTDVMLATPDGENMYYWDRLSQIIKNDRDENNVDKVSAYVQRNFGLVLFDAENMSYKFAKTVKPNSMLIAPSLKEKFSRTCWQLIRDFFPFTAYFSRLGDLANNAKLFYQLSTYSENLYKLRMTTLMCKFLEKKKKLVSNDEVMKKHRTDRAPRSRRNLRTRKYEDSDSEDDDDDDDIRGRR